MTFQTVFDIDSAGYAAWWCPALLVVAGGVMRLIRRQGSRQAALVFVSLGVVTFLVTALDHWRLRRAFDDGRAAFVEGEVSGFRPGGLFSHKQESFVVAGVALRYATYQIGGGFHRVAALGGPIRAGERVRAWHLGPTILKLQIARAD